MYVVFRTSLTCGSPRLVTLDTGRWIIFYCITQHKGKQTIVSILEGWVLAFNCLTVPSITNVSDKYDEITLECLPHVVQKGFECSHLLYIHFQSFSKIMKK